MSKFGIFFRTHFWDASVRRAYERLRSATKSDIYICADHTFGAFAVDVPAPVVPHTVAGFGERGLLCTPPNRALWYNGDYPLYANVAQTDCEHLLMVEYDLHLGAGLDTLIQRMLQDELDFCAPKLGRRGERWTWHRGMLQLLHEEIDAGSSPYRELPPTLGCLFPFAFISRRASEYLLERRKAQARLMQGRLQHPWGFCEVFAPTELAAGGFKLRALGHYVDESRVESRWPLHVQAMGDPAVAHPVLEGAPFLRKLFIAHCVETQQDYAARRMQMLELAWPEPEAAVDAHAAQLPSAVSPQL